MTTPYIITTALGNLVVQNDASIKAVVGNFVGASVTGAKISPTGFTSGSFTGIDGTGGPGPCTLTGATVGQRVLALFEIDTSSGNLTAAAGFESTITVADQIQQSSASDLSTKKYGVILMAVAA